MSDIPLGSLRVTNVSPSYPCADWVSDIGLTHHYGSTILAGTDSAGRRFPVFLTQRLAFTRVPLGPGEIRDLVLGPPGDDVKILYDIDPWVADEPLRLLPQFFARINGVDTPSLPVEIETDMRWLPVAGVTTFWARWPNCPLVIQGRMRTFTQQSVVEWELTAGFGTTQGQELRGNISRVYMRVGEYPVVDHRTTKGLHFPVWRGDVKLWEVELANPSVDWHRGRLIDLQGALLCMPPEEQLAAASTSPKALAMRYRREARPRGMVGGWQGRFGPFGIIPTIPEAERALDKWSFNDLVRRRLHTPGNEDDPRAFAQPPYSGTTGKQADLSGAIGYGTMFALAYGDPAALHYLEHDVGGDLRRPIHNREHETSRPVLASAHPQCTTFIGVPFPPLSPNDMIGWPREIPWITGYSASDDEHRAGLLLRGQAALTRRTALLQHINDSLEMDLMAYWRKRTPAVGQGIGPPRAWARPGYLWCWDHWLGFPQAEILVRHAIDWMWTAADWQRYPNAEIQVLETRTHKYGWYDGSTPIEGWWPWMEAQAVLFARAAQLLLGLDKARDIALRSARTIVRHGFYEHGGRWHCAYAVRDRGDGSAPPTSDYWPSEGANPAVFTEGALWEWTVAAAKILVEMEPTGADADRARSIVAYYGAPRDWPTACQFAVR